MAKAYILYRDRRARAREALGGAREGASGEASVLRHVRVREAEGTFHWSKSRIVAALVHEADLSREQAEDIALRVEGRVVASGTRRL